MYRCIICNVVVNQRRKYCLDHRPSQLNWLEKSLGELQGMASYQISARIRQLARMLTNFTECQVCGYNKHIEVCHIRAISDWPSDTKISEINKPGNLVGLCPNHHWELDQGIIKVS